ncbi:E3 ubiquitin-protein ligase PRT1-like isoform X2 [Macadamia integrifolia]|uniref:E3 ubiquitin-protein ligase PRT1-like isoform X2 n=1 Tax=Macadamia integrifolia TaxID=60698 RepID=UPI001C4EBCFE|nr:E3 ubiquitin-protein ligase PRT1-like isoform X2 [Macadamia integrifolia]
MSYLKTSRQWKPIKASPNQRICSSTSLSLSLSLSLCGKPENLFFTNSVASSISIARGFFMDEKKDQNVSPLASTTTSLDFETLDSDNDDEEFSESFVCCVCLDLLYKPIVLACGHISCFWCVQSAMNGWRESHCPICRQPYYNFPGICLMLHFLLLKMYPMAYTRREKQVLEEEKKIGDFSPQIDDHFCGSQINKELYLLSNPPHSSTSSQTDLYSDSFSTTICGNTSELDTVTTKKLAGEENEQNRIATCKQVSVSDVLCAVCKQLLFRPAVLNCGHVYCESCIVTLGVEFPTCQFCQRIHPKGLPKVCLDFDHFLEGQFPKEYELRKEAVHSYQSGSTSASATQGGKQDVKFSFSPKNLFFRWRENRSKIHFAVGCDSCGMFPIIGERYRCKDCVERIGFDLCGECYNTCSKLPGRFNQQHTPEHKFELIPTEKTQNWMRGVLATLYDGRSASVLSGDASPVPSHGDALEVPEYVSVAPINSHDSPEDQEDAMPVPLLFGHDPEVADNGSGAHTPSDDASVDPESPHTTI